MPRKTDGMLIELYPRPTKGDDGKPLLYVRPKSGRKKSAKDVDEFCTNHRSALKGDIDRNFEKFMEVAQMWIADGYRVETSLGTFAPKLKLDGDYTDPEQVKGKNVSFAGIEFTPSKAFLKGIYRKLRGFRKVETMTGIEKVSDKEQLEKALQQSLQIGYTTIQRFMYLTGLKYYSAKKYLDSLCQGEHPRLRRYKDGSSLHYRPVRG